ncbi:tRNA lysidine(34) synthetase TilS [Sphingomonas sp. AX6]|uniref:tRNA lysidine(34) synthetase TilS n=1 Tax=Sphingomonas sp. AX6 TaxID=2653171 RepID=UPI0012F1A7E3|nr:tRNA lysidine(34) synthetase TilS [Sphingomonas sp. AX6]VXC53959.1 tRNA(Ile)-lysidine synthase [Sphingomonas sp. AX6]
MLPDPLIARFRDDCRALLDRDPSAAAPLALAVSGGPDSMAMLALAAAAFPGAAIAATVDHGLRAEAADEAAMVAEWCAPAGTPHDILTVRETLPAASNLHDWARSQRYALLDDWARTANALAIVTGHHADDQAETFLMRAARGSGLAGLSGVRARNAAPNRVPIVRPLLFWRRAELLAVAAAGGIPHVDDPSNLDPRFDRAHFRTLLAATPELPAAALARSASHLAEAERDLNAIADWLVETRKVAPRDFDTAGLPRGVRRLMARRAIERVRVEEGIDSPAFTPATNIEPLLDALEQGNAATQAGIKVTPKALIWHFGPAPPRRSH